MKERRESTTKDVETWDEFVAAIEAGGFVRARFCMDAEVEAEIQETTKATVRVIPFDAPKDPGPCIRSGKQAEHRVIFARAY